MPVSAPSRLHHFFELSAGRNPGAAAVITRQGTWTYAALEAEASRMAHLLIEDEGIRPGDRVAVMLKPGPDAYVAILAVLKCGGTFVPVDPSFPAQRVEFIREDAEVKLVIDANVIHVLRAAAGGDTSTPVIAEGDGSRLAYIIYTSGTTGRPKGVGITHANIVNFFNVVPALYGVGPQDRVYQGMTPSFDFSLEEVWPTWIAGAALVPPPEGERLIGDELHAFLAREQVTVLYAVPTLLATLHEELPALHTINVGGEACPQGLVARWSRPGRRILNTYGPTETTITASWTELTPGRAVTIGRPLPTYSIQLLDESLRPVEQGASGEICIGGPGVAPGYINRSELTAEKFIQLNGERFYRTGDLGRMTPEGEIEFLGRIDTQVKIRGYRIELGEIESLITSQPHVAQALVHPFTGADGVTVLIAYLLLKPGHHLVEEARSAMHTMLKTSLPSYMVPSYLEVLENFPTLASGKADRARLPPPSSARLMATGLEAVPPQGATEQALAAVWHDVFKLHEVSATAHFFFDLGGDSLSVATVVSALRKQPRFVGLSVSDIYKHPSIRELAAHLDAQAPQATASAREIRRASFWQVFAAGCVQFIAVYALLIFFSETLTDALHVDDLGSWMLVALAYLVLSVVVWLLMPIGIKWLVIGRFKPGRYPLWGTYFLRWWIVRTALRFVPMDYLAGTPVMRVYLRLLGARIGSGCYVGSKNLLLPDLVSVGAGAHIGYNVDVLSHEIRDGWLIMEPVTIGDHAYIGANSVVFLGGKVGDGAMLGEQSLLPRHAEIPAGEYWQGSPAAASEIPDALRELRSRERLKGVPLTFWPTLGYLASAVILYLMMFASQAPCVYFIEEPMKQHQWGLVLAWLIPGGVANILFTGVMIAGAKRLVLPRLEEGVYPVHSLLAWRKWFSDKLVSTSLDVIYSVYATIYTKYWLRALGAKAGRGSEISTLNYFDPNMLELAPYSFIADQATLGASVFHNGWFAVRKTRVATRAFVGNSAHQSLGCHMEEGSLLGVLSHKQGEPMAEDSSWLGSPALHLQRREMLTSFDDSVLYTPPLRIVWLRYTIEFFRIIIPQSVLSVAFVATVQMQQSLSRHHSLPVAMLLSPACFLVVGTAMMLFTVVMKWLLVGRYRPRIAPLWSVFVWRSEMATALYENISLPLLLNWFTGSPVFNLCLRLFGSNIGRRVYCDTTYVTEFDLVHVGDDAALAENISLQTHLFEDRIMKLSHVRVGPGSVIGQRAVVLYDTDTEQDSVLAPLSLVIKGERLPAQTVWCGVPAQLRDDLAKVVLLLVLGITSSLSAGENPAPDKTTLETTFGYASHEMRTTFDASVDHSFEGCWHFIYGVEGERYDFGHAESNVPQTLQSAGVKLALEYRIGEDAVFSMEAHPGWYAGDDFGRSAFDVPVTARGLIPFNERWAGVAGFYYERLSHYPWLPVVGVAGEISKQWQVQLVFPESKLSFLPDEATTWSVFADLLGHGYKLPSLQKLEFYESRAGFSCERDLNKHWSVSAKAGWLFDRTFDFFKEDRSKQGTASIFMELGVSWSW